MRKCYTGLKWTVLGPSHVPGADLTGKWVLISGGNNGIGREAALQFAAWGANLVLACRQPPPHEQHPDVVVRECLGRAKAAGKQGSKVEWWEVDYTDLESVEAFARRWLESGRVLDVLWYVLPCREMIVVHVCFVGGLAAMSPEKASPLPETVCHLPR